MLLLVFSSSFSIFRPSCSFLRSVVNCKEYIQSARAGTSCEMERRRTRNSSSALSISSRFSITTSRKGDPTGTVTGRSRARRNARRDISWVFTTGSFVMRSSAKTWLTLAAMKKYVVRWTNWRTKTTRTVSLKRKFGSIETTSGSVRTW